MEIPDIHLDIGCGAHPRNPYGRNKLCGVDIRDMAGDSAIDFRVANLVLEPIPFAADSFGSVSAFDFIEHVPRILACADGRNTFFPFISLMNEIWRVLAPGGTFYALTPTYPSHDVFVDPTHVNVITERTHEYFCGSPPFGRMYGFTGEFKVRRAEWVKHDEAHVALSEEAAQARRRAAARRRNNPSRIIAYNVREALRLLRGRPAWQQPRDSYSHFLWELEAVKPPAQP